MAQAILSIYPGAKFGIGPILVKAFIMMLILVMLLKRWRFSGY